MATKNCTISQRTSWYKVYFEYSYTQNQTTNKSTVTHSLILEQLTDGGDFDTVDSVTVGYYVNGKYFYKTGRIDIDNVGNTGYTITLASGESVISHDDLGEGSFTVKVSTSINSGGYGPGSITLSEQTIDLPKIDRQAFITSADNFNNTFLQPKVNYSNPNGYSFGACIAMHQSSSGTWQADIPENAYIEVGSDKSGTWTFDLTDETKYPGAIDKLKSLTANKTTLPFRFYLRTILNNTPLYSHTDKIFTVVKNSKTEPKLYPSITVDDNTWGVTRSNNVFIKGITNIVVNAHPQAQWGASIKSCSIKCGNSTIASQAGEFQNIQSEDVVFSATDSRGFTTTITTKGTLIDYIPVTATLIASNPNGEGEATIKIDGDYFHGSFGVSDNDLTIQYRIKVEDGDYGNWITIPYTPYENRYSITYTITGLDYTKKITFQARAYDMLTSAVTDEQARKAVPVFYWGKDIFSFNTNIIFDGGEQTDERSVKFKNTNGANTHNCTLYGGNPNSTTGIGLWDTKHARRILAYLDNANDLKLGNDSCYITSERRLRTLAVSSGSFMGASQSVTLSDKVSNQLTGIIIAWSYYNGSSQNYDWNYTFIPKEHVLRHSGAGIDCTLAITSTTSNLLSTKYIYVADETITGHEFNGTDTNSRKFVLRYVYGV